MEDVLCIGEATAFLRIGKSTLDKLIAAGKGPRVLMTPGRGKRLFWKQDLIDWLNEHEYVPHSGRRGSGQAVGNAGRQQDGGGADGCCG